MINPLQTYRQIVGLLKFRQYNNIKFIFGKYIENIENIIKNQKYSE
jgi:hypothetical protein